MSNDKTVERSGCRARLKGRARRCGMPVYADTDLCAYHWKLDADLLGPPPLQR